ncbi:MAG TPA: hypothetical protein VHY19_12420 [Steroidobacteraceae bacterium]|jgi:hypothetical protein|nr:hypothetical protein [Steroidobacteraceae bacterium]
MRRWWIGAACLAVSAALHAQGSVQQSSPAAPTGSSSQTGAPNAPLPLSATPPAPAAAPTPQSAASANVSSNELSAPAAPVTQAPAPKRIPVGNQSRQRRHRAPRPEPSTPSPITDHFALRGIYFMGHVATRGQFDPANGMLGTSFSAEQTLGLSDRTDQARVELIFRLEQRNRLRLNFIDLRRSGEAELTEPLQYGDQLFKASSLLQSEVDWRQTDFTYTYSFIRTDRVELGVGAALHLIQAEATAQVPNTPQRVVYSTAGPFVTFAADGTVRIDRHWSLNARGQYFKVTINNDNGMLGIYHADLQYRWRANFAVGTGYEYERVYVDLLHTDPSGFVQFRISGPELFARLSF